MRSGDEPVAGPSVLIVEDHELLAQSLQYALSRDGFDVVVAPGVGGEQVLARAREMQPSVVLLDLHLDAVGTSSLRLIAPLRELGTSVVMMTGERDRVRLAECVEAGAIGIVSKAAPFEQLVAAVREAAGLGMLLTRGQRDQLLAELRRQRAADEERLRPFRSLTAREREVLAALMQGRSAERIAADAVVSLATVRSQIRSVLQKLQVNSQLQAVALARRSGWTP
jgi:two-component system, NarL family, nitrate/nitrite response regulator NarL